MTPTATNIALQIRRLYNTMKRNTAEATINGHRVEVSTGKAANDFILVMVEDGNGNHLWFKASKNASSVNNLYNISEKAAQTIA